MPELIARLESLGAELERSVRALNDIRDTNHQYVEQRHRLDTASAAIRAVVAFTDAVRAALDTKPEEETPNV